LKSGFQAVSTFLLTALRAKYQKIIEEHPDEAANLRMRVRRPIRSTPMPLASSSPSTNSESCDLDRS
jgi:hypothetical protein